MSFVNNHKLTLDTTNYDTALKRVQSHTDATFGQMGQRLGESTQGWRRLSGAITGTVGSVTGIVGVFGLAATAVGGIAAGIDKLRSASERMREQVAAEHRERVAMLGTVQKTVTELRQMASLGPRLGEAGSVRSAGAAARGDIDRRLQESSAREIQSQTDLLHLEATMRKLPLYKSLRLAFDGTTPEAEMDRLRQSVVFEQGLQENLRGQSAAASRAEREASRRALFMAAGDAASRRVASQAEMLRLAGNPEDASMLGERDRFERQLYELEQRRQAGDEFAAAEMADARAIHEARMANFANEKRTRLANEAEVARKEQENAEKTRRTVMRGIADVQMESAIDRARALGDTSDVERLTRQQGRVRRLRSIQDADVPPEVRARAMRSLMRSIGIEDALGALGLGASGGGAAGGGGLGRLSDPVLGAGLGGDRSFASRALGVGNPVEQQTARAAKDTATNTQQAVEVLRSIFGGVQRLMGQVGVVG